MVKGRFYGYLDLKVVYTEVKGMIGRIGPTEIILILAVALIIFGPAKLPELGRSIGNGLKEFRKATKDLKDSVSLDSKDGINLDDNETNKRS